MLPYRMIPAVDKRGFCDLTERGRFGAREATPYAHAAGALQQSGSRAPDNPPRFEKRPLYPILRIHLPVPDRAKRVAPEHRFFPSGHAIRPLPRRGIQDKITGRLSLPARFAAALCFALWTASARGEKVVLKIRAGNPIESTQRVKIHSVLPAGATSNDIISSDGLDVGYDIKSGSYYVHKELDLQPREIRIFNVELRDVWTIPPQTIETIRRRAADMEALLASRPGGDAEAARALREEIEKNAALIESSQSAAALKPGEKMDAHIKAYEANLGTLKRAKEALGRLENMVLAAGLDPGGELIGEVRGLAAVRREVEIPPESCRPLVVRITVRNVSPTEARKVTIRRDLPAEIRLEDILDPGELDARKDPKTGLCYVYREGVDIPPNESVSYDVVVRDKWNINGPRIAAVKESATNLLTVAGAAGRYPSVVETLRRIIAGLEELEAEKGPSELNEQYVDFYRRQAQRLDELERQVLRIEAALKPKPKTAKLGFSGKPPSEKTTWRIIYIILVFLGIFSFLFFLRWYGRGPADKVGRSGGGGGQT